MTDRPIIFSAAMIRALLEGRKTQTRRLATSPLRRVEVGDRLYVREEFHAESWYDRYPAKERTAAIAAFREPKIWYEAGYWLELSSGNRLSRVHALDLDAQWSKGIRRPGMHMPRWASRLTLIVEGVKVEPVQSISAEDARDEGVDRRSPKVRQFWLFGADADARERIYLQACPWEYEDLWNSLHSEEGQRWQDNPDVVALTFRVVRANIDQVSA